MRKPFSLLKHKCSIPVMIMVPLFSLLLCFPIASTGQALNIESQITEQTQSRSETISAFRRLLLDKFLEEDFQMVQQIREYLIREHEDPDYAVFWAPEHFLLLYWTHDYDQMLKIATTFDYDYFEQFSRQIKPPYDLLYTKLIERTLSARESMESYIENDPLLQTEQKEFLVLLLHHLMEEGSDEENNALDSSMINTMAGNYLQKYPDSEYEYFIRHFIRFSYQPSTWGFGFEFFSGYGLFTGTLDSKYTHNIPMGVAFDLYYNNFVFNLRNYIGFNRTREDIIYPDVVWQRRSQARVFLPELSVGYGLRVNKNLNITPFAGYLITMITATENDIEELPELRDAGVVSALGLTTGINLEIALGQPYINTNLYGIRSQNQWVLRIRYAYSMPGLRDKYPNSSGNIHTITIGAGSIGRKIKRDI